MTDAEIREHLKRLGLWWGMSTTDSRQHFEGRIPDEEPRVFRKGDDSELRADDE